MLTREPKACRDTACTRWAVARGYCAEHDPKPRPVKAPIPPKPRKAITRTPMKRPEPGPPKPRTPLPTKRAKPRPKPTTPKAPREGITEATRLLVLTRCGSRCEACGKRLVDAVDMHHRQPRILGRHDPANVVALHPSCHTVAPEAVHQRPEWARERGLIVSRHTDPSGAPLTLPSGRRVLLTVEGGYAPYADTSTGAA